MSMAPCNSCRGVLDGLVENPANGAAGALGVWAVSNSHFLEMKVPRAMTWSLGIQRKLAHEMSLTVTYVGSSAANLSYQQDINQLPLGLGKTSFVPGTTTLANTNYLRPSKTYSTIYHSNTATTYIYTYL